ncbi:hypothetical protein [Pedobacter hartonius]|uniref:Uncharacterized protein n=1 Tax=Pedobacter hartonius TaxID=425514 RepID=A0A1H4G676_9SPHI|nr:hypothetical protein [Pedobacter hartonius]SEB05099.1 hypothetical protein SAMN05443550_10966 [Pedobacter hartonius]
MENYEFTGEIQGEYRQIKIYPMLCLSNHYLIHWDGFEVGVIKKVNGKWHSDNEALSDYVEELGSFIDKEDISV